MHHPLSSQFIPLDVTPCNLPKYEQPVEPSQRQPSVYPVQFPLVPHSVSLYNPVDLTGTPDQHPPTDQPVPGVRPVGTPPFESPVEHHQPIFYSPYHNFNYPPPPYVYPYSPSYDQTPHLPQPAGPSYDLQHASMPQGPPDMNVVQPTQVPQLPPQQQLPPRGPVFPIAPSKTSPSLACKGNHLVVELPSAKSESFKVKGKMQSRCGSLVRS